MTCWVKCSSSTLDELGCGLVCGRYGYMVENCCSSLNHYPYSPVFLLTSRDGRQLVLLLYVQESSNDLANIHSVCTVSTRKQCIITCSISGLRSPCPATVYRFLHVANGGFHCARHVPALVLVRTEQLIPDGFEGDLRLRNTGRGTRLSRKPCKSSVDEEIEGLLLQL